jgi:hypothetical protein
VKIEALALTFPIALLAACGKPAPTKEPPPAVTIWQCAMSLAEADNRLSNDDENLRFRFYSSGIELRETQDGDWSASGDLFGGVIREHPPEDVFGASPVTTSGNSEDLFLNWQRYGLEIVAHLYRPDANRNIRAIEVKAAPGSEHDGRLTPSEKRTLRTRAVGVCLKQAVTNPSKIPDDMK